MSKVSREVAEKDVERWLDFKRVKGLKREKNKEAIESMIECVMDGTLVVDEECVITHNLLFPLGNDESIRELKYAPRLTVGRISEYTKNSKTNDERVCGYISALSGQANGIISKMETEDYSVVGNVVIFFF
jgi:hypothetical protein